MKTELTVTPKDVNMGTWEEEVIFECAASGDPSTPVTIKWYFDGVEIDLSNNA